MTKVALLLAPDFIFQTQRSQLVGA